MLPWRMVDQDFTTMPDRALLDATARLAGAERAAMAQLIAALSEIDTRRLYLGEGCSSLFTYCTQVLHLSEHAAYGRIEAARAARKWPAVLEQLSNGSVHLTAVTLLAPHLTDDNHCDLLARARHRSKREVEAIVAMVRPQPPVASSVRKLSVPKSAPPAASSSADVHFATTAQMDRTPSGIEPPKRPAGIKPLAPEHYKVQFTVSRETYDKLREAQDLLRHRVPNGDIAAVFDRALTALLTELHKAKHAAVERPRARCPGDGIGRHVPAAVKREVWERDGGQCAFVGTTGRCTERGFLEYHHVVPFADGGATTAPNLELRCRAHNAYEAEQWFGVGEGNLVREGRASFECSRYQVRGAAAARPTSLR